VRIYAIGEESLLTYTQAGNAPPSGTLTLDWLPMTDSTNRPFVPGRPEPLLGQLPFQSAPLPVFTTSPNSILTTVAGDPDNLPNETNPALPVAESVFLTNQQSGQWECFTRPFGRLQTVPNLNGVPKRSNIYALRGITGPLPIPNENTQPYTGSFPNGPDCGHVVYGNTKSASQTRSFNISFTEGIQTQGQMSKGLGPAWNIAINGGAGHTSTNSEASQLVKNTFQPTPLNPDRSVKNQGTLFATVMSFSTTLYRFLLPIVDGARNYGPAANASTSIVTAPTFNGERDQFFAQYDVTPGDLTSYTREAWNRKMQNLGYGSPNYFDEVIEANAYVFDPDGSAANYLEIDWTLGALTLNGFAATQTSVKEFRWTFNSSIYVGVSCGFGVSVFGVGAEMQGQFMLGVTLSLEGDTQTQQQEGWGLNIQNFYCPSPTNK